MKVAVHKDKFARGSNALVAGPSVYTQLDVRAALERVYTTDAHCVGYILDGVNPQPRVNKSGVNVSGDLRVHTLLFDIDLPQHGAWTDALELDARAALDRVCTTEGWFATKGGYRIVQPLATPLGVWDAERVLRARMMFYVEHGIAVDNACKDWTRHFRLPRVRRDGVQTVPRFEDYSRMMPVDFEVPEADVYEPEVEGSRAPRRPRLAVYVPTLTLPALWVPMVEPLADAVLENVRERWHDMYMSLAGSLLGWTSFPAELVPALIEQVAVRAASSKPGAHRQGAEDTARRWNAKQRVTQRTSLLQGWPSVGRVLDKLIELYEREAVRQTNHEHVRADVAAASDALLDLIVNAPLGVSLVGAEAGLGKTRAAERACAIAHAAGRRTAIAVDKHALAEQIENHVRVLGVPVARLFGPGHYADGPLACRKRSLALPIIDAGLSLRQVLCPKCEHRPSCCAFVGRVGDEDATVLLGPHSLLKELAAHAGVKGTLIIDEPSGPSEHITVTGADLELLLEHRRILERPFRDEMVALANRILSWPTGELATDVLYQGEQLLELRRGQVPLTSQWARKLHTGHPSATRLVPPVIRTAMALYTVVTSGGRFVADREGGGFVATLEAATFVEALRTSPVVVVLDAGIAKDAPIYEKVCGYVPPMHRIGAPDGAPIARTWWRQRGCNRTGWLPHGRLNVEAVAAPLRRTLAWLREDRDGAKGLITFMAVRQWMSSPEGVRMVGDTSDIMLGHYGAVRGLDGWKSCTSLATLGDPFPNVGTIEREVELWQIEARDRTSDLAIAELEQAQGRLRVVHRTVAARALHVGTVRPGGTGWGLDSVDVQTVTGRPRVQREASSAEQLKIRVADLGGVGKAAIAFGITARSLSRYLSGRQGVPARLS